MSLLRLPCPAEHGARIPTWFRVGGNADTLASPRTTDDLKACLSADPELRVLGEGANLLVADAGVRELVVRFARGPLREAEIEPASGRVRVGAGHDLAKLIHATVRAGLTGLEGLIGVPATLGGAARMNAGGAFGQIADTIERVHAISRDGAQVVLDRGAIPFGYRTSGLDSLIITGLDLRLTPGSPEAARERLKSVMAKKSVTQPLRAATCGCVFRNPTLTHDLDGVGVAGERVSAGKLIDRAGGKRLAEDSCRVSAVHANFVETADSGTAGDVLRLIDRVRRLVLSRFGIELETELVVWGGTP